MSFFGLLAPKFIGNILTTQDEINLDYCEILKDQPEQNLPEVKSVRTGRKKFTHMGKHWVFIVKINLWKYADPLAQYLILKGFEKTAVYLYRHRDGMPLMDTYGNNGVFVITNIKEHCLVEFDFRDYVIITFESTDYISAPSTIINYCTEFNDNSFYIDVFELINLPVLPTNWQINNNRIEGTFGVAGGYTSLEIENYKLFQFRVKKRTAVNTDIEVRGDIWKESNQHSRTIMLGVWADEQHFAGICVDNVYLDNKVAIIICDGGTRGIYAHLVDCVLDLTIQRKYRINYQSSINKLSFDYWTGAEWSRMGATTYEIANFGSRNYYCGVFGACFNAYTGGTIYADNFCCSFEAEA